MTQLTVSSALEQLRQTLLAAVQHNTLQIDQQTLGQYGANLYALFSTQYKITSFTIDSNLVISNIIDDTLLEVSGGGTLQSQATTFTASFTDTGTDIQVKAVFQASTVKALQTMFGSALASDFFAGIANPDSAPSVQFPAGLPNATFTQAVFGVAGYAMPGGGMTNFYLAPQVVGQVKPGANPLSLMVELPVTTDGYWLMANDDATWDFTALGWLLPAMSVVANFPSIIPTTNLKLNFGVYLYPTAPDFSTLLLSVSNATDPTAPLWSAYNGKIQLTSVTVGLTLQYTTTAVTGTNSGFVQGAFQLGSVLISVQIPFPFNQGTWLLEAYPNLSIGNGLSDLAHLLPGGSSFDQLMPAQLSTILNAFEFTYLAVAINGSGFGLQYFSFSISTTSTWTLIQGVLALDSLNVQMTIDGQAQITGAVQGHFLIGTSDVYVSVQRYTPQGDWYLTILSPVIALPNLSALTSLANGTDLSPYIQASGLDTLQFYIYNLAIGFDLTTRKLTNLGLTLKLANSATTTDPKLQWNVIPGILTLSNFSVDFQLSWQPNLKVDVTGFFTLNGLNFALKFGKDQKADAFLAVYSAGADGGTVDLKALINTISPAIADLVPTGLELGLQDIFIAYINYQGKGKKFIFAMDASIEIPLTGIPLIGDALGDNARVDIKNVKVVVTSDALSADEVNYINQLIQALPPEMKVIPLATPSNTATGPVLTKGFTVSASLTILGQEILISAPTTTPQTTVPTLRQLPAPASYMTILPPEPDLPAGSVTDSPQPPSTMWITIQKTFGPVTLDQVGFRYQNGALFVLLNASLNVGGLSIELLGFGIGTSLSKPDIRFTIDGLAISYQEGPILIAGGMLGTLDPVNFVGFLVVQTEGFNLTAMGGYATVQDQPSMFLYGVFNEPPLGGDPSFFITGLAGGFGFNRKLLIPDVSQVYSFPFVAWATGTGAPSMDPTKPIGEQVAAALKKLGDAGFVAPQIGEYWLAGGILFTTYELVNSFALLTVSFGTDFEIDLLGLATITVPPAVPPAEVVAEVQLELKVSFSPSTGVFSIAGQLTPNSYILSRDCRLTGGFAFYLWFAGDHAGDFVLTLGGYNPHFAVPSYYPTVPRLGLNWKVIPSLSITGELYFALTSTAVMAGGKLSAVWDSGPIHAWFTVWADFLMIFKPFHYYIDAGIDLGASFSIKLLFVRINITIHIGVSLEIWGPNFAGKATIDLSIISFTIHFGDSGQQTNTTLPWSDFVTQLLPSQSSSSSARLGAEDVLATDSDDTSVIHLKLMQGLINPLNNDPTNPWFLVSGETFQCLVETVIPSKDTDFSAPGNIVSLAPQSMQPHDDHGNPIPVNTNFGAGIAGIQPSDFQPKLTITMTAATTNDSKVYAVYNLKAAPKAYWENKQFTDKGVPIMDPQTGFTQSTIANTLQGFLLVPFVPPPDHTKSVYKKYLEYTIDDNIQSFEWSTPTYATSDQIGKVTVADTITSPSVTKIRSQWLTAMAGQKLALNSDIHVESLSHTDNNDLMSAPQLRLLGEQKLNQQEGANGN